MVSEKLISMLDEHVNSGNKTDESLQTIDRVYREHCTIEIEDAKQLVATITPRGTDAKKHVKKINAILPDN